jgi:hypothetical protein
MSILPTVKSDHDIAQGHDGKPSAASASILLGPEHVLIVPCGTGRGQAQQALVCDQNHKDACHNGGCGAHTVEVAEQGFLYAGRRYRSLSEIARVITGALVGTEVFGL